MAIFVNIPGGEDFADISEDHAAERIGERIRKIREAREMTRAELGELIGLDQNRVQQYENGKRKPKFPLLKQIASALGVETIALMDPSPASYVSAMYALFEMEEKLDMKIVMRDGHYCLEFGDGVTGGMNTYLADWYKVNKELEEALPNLSDEERQKKIFDYNMFEWTYPKGIARGSHKKYNEHPINRLQEIKEDKEQSELLLKKFDEKLNAIEEANKKTDN